MKSLNLGYCFECPNMDLSINASFEGEGDNRTVAYEMSCSFQLDTEDQPIELDTEAKVLAVLENFVDWQS